MIHDWIGHEFDDFDSLQFLTLKSPNDRSLGWNSIVANPNGRNDLAMDADGYHEVIGTMARAILWWKKL